MLPLLLTLTLLAPASLTAEELGHHCLITLLVTSCSGEPKSAVSLAAVTQQGEGDDVARWQATTDLAGKAEIAVCAEDVVHVEIYFMEDAEPIISEPQFESEPSSPDHARATLVVC